MRIELRLLAGILVLSAAAQAAPITYGLDLEVTEVYSPLPAGSVYDGPADLFRLIPAAGDVFHGSLTFDDAVLATDGAKTGIPLDAFRLEIAGLVWDPDDASSVFRGFRGPGLEAVSPVLVIAGGALTGLRGGVYAVSDAPFVDFQVDGTFWSRDFQSGILGVLTVGSASLPEPPIASVPEPGSLALLLLGLGGIAGAAVRNRASGHARSGGENRGI